MRTKESKHSLVKVDESIAKVEEALKNKGFRRAVDEELLGQWFAQTPSPHEFSGVSGRLMSVGAFRAKYLPQGMRRGERTIKAMIQYGLLRGYFTREKIKTTGKMITRTYIEDTEYNLEILRTTSSIGSYYRRIKVKARGDFLEGIVEAYMFAIRQGWIQIEDYEYDGVIPLGVFFPFGVMMDFGIIYPAELSTIRSMAKTVISEWAKSKGIGATLSWASIRNTYYPVEFVPTLQIGQHFLSIRRFKGGFYRFVWVPGFLKDRKHSFRYEINLPPEKVYDIPKFNKTKKPSE